MKSLNLLASNRRFSLPRWVLRSLLTLALSCSSFGAMAQQEGQFYLLAKYAALGASSSTGQNKLGVYLRWGVLDGQLPDDISRITLVRDDLSEPLLEFTPADLMASSEIYSQIYGLPYQQQRLFHTVTLLKERALAAVANEVAGAQDFNPQQFADELRQQLQQARANPESEQSLWAYLAARADFNIARAAYRGYLDTEVAGKPSYRLLAYNAGGTERQLGRVSVTVDSAELGKTRVLSASNFRQITEQSCNPIDRHSDHGSIALAWDQPGSTSTERVANDIALSGYDLFRSRTAVTVVTDELLNRDIAALAAAAPHDARGEPVLEGLNKINASLITNRGNRSASDNPADDIQWQEDRARVDAAGMKPGQQWIYYLVPRDFAGHYGPTTALVVQVPDRAKPKTPWAFNTLVDAPNNGALLVWDAVNVANYLAHYVGDDSALADRKVCNSASAVSELAVDYVAAGESCDIDTQVRDYLNVVDYRVYRFNSFNEAINFSDRDGDGIADSAESGAARCVPAGQPSLSGPLIATGADLETDSQQLLLRDGNKEAGRSYWYRLAAVSPSGVVSHLTPPEQFILVDRTPPEAPVVVATELCDKKTPDECEPETVQPGRVGGGVKLEIAVEDDECAELYIDIDGELARVASSCGEDDSSRLVYEHDYGELCGVAVAVDADGNVSAGTQLPCSVSVVNQPISPPQLRSFALTDSDGASQSLTTWRLPLQPISGINLELSHNGQVWHLATVTVSGEQPASIGAPHSIPIEVLNGSSDQWCVRLQSVGPHISGEPTRVSQWTNKRCQTRRALGIADSDNLPWPAAQPLSFTQTDLLAHSGSEYVTETRALFERYFLFVDLIPATGLSPCSISEQGLVDGYLPLFANFNCPNNTENAANTNTPLTSRLQDWLPMLVYRRAITPTGTQGPWVQVTPLLEEINFIVGKPSVMSDPYFGIYRQSLSQNQLDWRLAYIDRYPHLKGYRYQYQFVSFDNLNRIRAVRQSTIVEAQ